jgi:hypothetical protein
MSKHIHIHINAPVVKTRDVEAPAYSKEAYRAWAKEKSLDPQSRVTFKKYVREKGLNPTTESLLERSANIGSKDTEYDPREVARLKSSIKELNSRMDKIVESGGRILLTDPLLVKRNSLLKELTKYQT